MFARVTVLQGSPDDFDDAARVMREQTIPAARGVPGLVNAYWAFERASGKGVVFAVYESEDALRASEEQVRQLREAGVAAAGGQIVSVDSYEIIGQI